MEAIINTTITNNLDTERHHLACGFKYLKNRDFHVSAASNMRWKTNCQSVFYLLYVPLR